MVICDECGVELPLCDVPLLDGFPVCRPCMAAIVSAGDMTATERANPLLGRNIYGELSHLSPIWDYEYV